VFLEYKANYIIDSAYNQESVCDQPQTSHQIAANHDADSQRQPNDSGSNNRQYGGKSCQNGIQKCIIDPEKQITSIRKHALNNCQKRYAYGICLDNGFGFFLPKSACFLL